MPVRVLSYIMRLYEQLLAKGMNNNDVAESDQFELIRAPCGDTDVWITVWRVCTLSQFPKNTNVRCQRIS